MDECQRVCAQRRATWTSHTLDPTTGLLYVPGGNPAPDFINDVRQGDNLYTDSVVVLDAKTEAYRRLRLRQA